MTKRRSQASRRSVADRVMAPAGLVLLGAGLSVAMDASTRRALGHDRSCWVARGTVGLALVGSGLSVFGDAVRREAQQPRRPQR